MRRASEGEGAPPRGPLGDPFPQEKAGPGGLTMQTGLGRALWALINGQEKRFHYAGMSGEGEGRADSLPAPASPAALIDVPCTTAASGPGGRRPLHHSPLLEPGQQPDVPGLCGAGMGAGKAGSGPGGSRPDVKPLPPSRQLGSRGIGLAVDLWPVARLPGP